jgi:hypothetical protein
MGLRRWVLPFLMALGISGVAQVAHAAPSARDRQDAAVLTNKARAAARALRHGEAVDLLRKADQLDPTSARKLELSKSLVAEGKLVEASQILNGIINDASLSPRDKWAKDAAKKQLAQFESRIPWLQVHVVGPTGSAKVRVEVDGKEVEADTEAPVDPGKHAVGVDAEGFESADRNVTVAEGEHKQVTLTLEAVAKSAPPKPKESGGGGTKIPAIASFVIGAAGIGVGSAFGILAFDETAKARQFCKDNLCPATKDVVSARNTAIANGNVSTVGFVVGGVGLAAGVILLLTVGSSSDASADKAEKKDAFTVRPYVGAGEAGIVGTF